MRSIIRVMMAAVFVLLLSVHWQPAKAQTRFTSCFDFAGVYSGKNDGRDATISIETFGISPAGCRFFIRFSSGGQNWCINLRRNESPAHIVHDITLRSESGGENVVWRALYLHTWDIRYLSGVSVWGGKEFGMSFTKTGQVPQVFCTFNE